MALDTYTNLKTAVADWLNRTDLTSQIPDFITLAEAEMKRRLRRSSTRTTITVTSAVYAVPADCAELRSAYINDTQSSSRNFPIKVGSPEQVQEARARFAGVTARPIIMAIMAGNFIFAPDPDATYTMEIFYFTQLTALSGTTASNAILVEAPDAYLFGALMQAAPYLEHDERIPTWEKKFDDAIDQLNEVRTREEYGGSIRDIRLPRVFG